MSGSKSPGASSSSLPPWTLSTSGSSSPLTASKQVRGKRVVNLVNPADPMEFSDQSLASSMSMTQRKESARAVVVRDDKENTPMPNQAPMSYTPLGVKDGVRGILRQTGTPGSGNGVRFFPKNRFRVITPNASVLPPAPPSPSSNSFFSQLLAVTIPSMSPRPPPASPSPVKGEKADESWEVPGQEGEISLVASSQASFEHSRLSEGNSGEVEEDSREVSWNGQVEVHSSPLGLSHPELYPDSQDLDEVSLQSERVDTGNTIGLQRNGEELPSMELYMSKDVSNLLDEKFTSPSDNTSFSVSEFSRSNYPSSRFAHGQDTPRPIPMPVENSFGASASQSSLDRSNPTVRHALSPVRNDASEFVNVAPETPKSAGKPSSRSIFADMSAEQADLSWPLNRGQSTSPDSAASGEDTAFHSALFADISPSKPLTVPSSLNDLELSFGLAKPTQAVRLGQANLSPGLPSSSSVGQSSFLPRRSLSVTPGAAGNGSIGNVTQFFDCDSPTPSTNALSLSTSKVEPLVRSMSASTSRSPLGALVQPTRALFEAHSAHTAALVSELELYRSLVQKLQGEVSERDSVLADLNLRVIEGEMTRVKLSEMEQEIRSLKSASNGNEDERSLGKGDGDSFLLSKMRKSLSPSTAQKTVEMGDRTTVAEASNRDMEIRLAKALSEQESLKTELDKEIEARTELQQELVQSRATVRRLEDAEKERGVVGQLDRQRSRVEEELRTQLELVSKRERSLHANLAQVESQLEQAQQQSTEQQFKISTLEEQARQAQQWRDEAQQASVRANELEGQVEDFESQVDEFERQLNSVNDQRNMLERAVRDLRTVQQADEAELGRLASEVDSAERARESDAEANEGVVLGLRRELEEEREGRQEAERLIEQLQTQCEDLISKGHESEQAIQTLEARLAEAERSAKIGSAPSPPSGLLDEIAKLKSASASKDLDIITLQRRKSELKEDLEMLNIALDSKQQELELMKRRFAVKGVAGSTPLVSSQKGNINLESTSTSRYASLETPAPGRGRRVSSLMSKPLVTPSYTAYTSYNSSTLPNRVLRTLSKETPMAKSSAEKAEKAEVDREDRRERGDENRPPVKDAPSVRKASMRQRVLA